MTYFLEQLIAEWYAFQGYFVRTNVKFGPRTKGGYEGEMDVVAFHPGTRVLVHVEASMDADSWSKREGRLARKFGSAERRYRQVFPFQYERIEKVAVLGLNRTRPKGFAVSGVSVKSLPELFGEIATRLHEHSPIEKVVPEQWPLLRAIQMTVFWGREPG